ncbi:coronatine-insensitive protein 1-like protein [Tanacetum coccineum]|uniref:Coronatine-insensitive protein 1-like protein n=1 Tax=Tanacetum coccineum TaxID=301880 RepID=A0ABQ4XP36_9ASTR
MYNHNNKECCYITDSTDTLFDCIIPYIHPNDLNSVSLTSRGLYVFDSLTRKPNKPQVHVTWGSVDHRVAEIRKSIKRLKCVRFKRMIVFYKDLERLAEMCEERIRDLRIEACTGFTTDRLLYVGKKCSELRVLSLDESLVVEKEGDWLRELAERSKGIETFSLFRTRLSNYDCGGLVKIAKNCGKPLVKLRIGDCQLKYVVDIFRYGVNFGENEPEIYGAMTRS